MVLTDALAKVYSSGGPSIILETLELNHHAFPNILRIVRDHIDHEFGLEDGGPTVTFFSKSFSVVQPKKTDKGIQTLKIQIDDVDRNIVDLMEATQDGTNTPIDVTYRVYLSTAKTEPQDTPIKLSLFNVTITNGKATGTARRDDIINRKFPSILYNREVFISLFN